MITEQIILEKVFPTFTPTQLKALTNCTLTGGYIRDTLAGVEPNDVDCLVRGYAMPDIRGVEWVNMAGYRGASTVIDGRKFQRIYTNTSYAEHIQSFDFTVCQIGVEMSDSGIIERIYEGATFEEDLNAKVLRYNPAAVLRADQVMERLVRLVRKGFIPTPATLAKTVRVMVEGSGFAKLLPLKVMEEEWVKLMTAAALPSPTTPTQPQVQEQTLRDQPINRMPAQYVMVNMDQVDPTIAADLDAAVMETVPVPAPPQPNPQLEAVQRQIREILDRPNLANVARTFAAPNWNNLGPIDPGPTFIPPQPRLVRRRNG